jgi:hypothetical protein
MDSISAPPARPSKRIRQGSPEHTTDECVRVVGVPRNSSYFIPLDTRRAMLAPGVSAVLVVYLDPGLGSLAFQDSLECGSMLSLRDGEEVSQPSGLGWQAFIGKGGVGCSLWPEAFAKRQEVRQLRSQRWVALIHIVDGSSLPPLLRGTPSATWRIGVACKPEEFDAMTTALKRTKWAKGALIFTKK